MFGKLSQFINPTVAVDLGTANTLIHISGKGIVVNEPSYVALSNSDHNSSKLIAVGHQAKAMAGRTPDKVRTVRPIREGVISDFRATERMVKHWMEQGITNRSLIRPVVAVCVPSGITEVERRAVTESFDRAGARRAILLPEPLAAAVGAGLPISEPTGSMIVDIGGGTTEVAVISLSGVVYSESIRTAGDKLDEMIMNYVKRNYNLLIGEQTAERIKMTIGAARVSKEERMIEVSGRDLLTALPRKAELCEAQVVEAIIEPVKEIISLIKRVLEHTPAELVGDVADRGITLTGGGALLKNIDAVIADETDLPVTIAQDPLTCGVTGCGEMLKNLDAFSDAISR